MVAKASGYAIGEAEMPVVLAMVARGDRKHDIAAWFGVNQGRIKQAEQGKWGTPALADNEELPPKGAPGMKGRRLRAAVAEALSAPTLATMQDILSRAAAEYDADEA